MHARLSFSFVALIATLFVASAASAALNVTVSSAQTSYVPGDTVTIDIYIETTGPEARALGLRAANYDPTILTNATATIVPTSIFNFAPSVPVGGLVNSAIVGEQAPLAGVRAGWSINLFQGIALSPAASAGPEHFQIQFVMGNVGTTTVDVGAFLDYSDTYTGGDNVMNPASITIHTAPGIPEPGTAILLGLGLVGLARSSRLRR